MAKARLDWVDTAKGISILLVVLVHAAHWVEYAGVSSRALTDVNEALSTLRMPLFFCMSGLFAAKWLDRSWRELWSGKLSLLLWVFIVWQPMVLGYKLLAAGTLPDQEDTSVLAHLARFVLSPVRPSGELWFLWGLVLFFVVAKLLSRLPVWLHLAVAAAIWSLLAALALLSGGVLSTTSCEAVPDDEVDAVDPDDLDDRAFAATRAIDPARELVIVDPRVIRAPVETTFDPVHPSGVERRGGLSAPPPRLVQALYTALLLVCACHFALQHCTPNTDRTS